MAPASPEGGGSLARRRRCSSVEDRGGYSPSSQCNPSKSSISDNIFTSSHAEKESGRGMLGRGIGRRHLRIIPLPIIPLPIPSSSLSPDSSGLSMIHDGFGCGLPR